MKNRCLLPALCAALLLCLGLTACSQRGVETKQKPIAMHMHWLRNMGLEEEAQFKMVREAGVRMVEISGKQELPARELKALLDKYGLRAVDMYMASLNEIRNNLDELLAFNRVIGNSVLVVPSIPREERPDNAQGWLVLGKELGQLAERVAAAGMTLAYHNHGYEMAEFDGKTVLELLFEDSGPALKSELDVGWVAQGGQDPVAMLEKLSGRVYSLHVKDLPAPDAEDQGYVSLGQGTLDWAAIFSAAERAGAQWYVIDHANKADPVAAIKASAEYLNEHLPAGSFNGRKEPLL